MENQAVTMTETPSPTPTTEPVLGRERTILLVLTLMLAGRAMTLAFIGDVGGSGADDPPDPWLMPLIGDAVVGLSALPIAYLVMRGKGAVAWAAIAAWNVVGVWDALSAWLVNEQTPWPEFFMLEIFGESMFFAASAMHIVAIALLLRPEVKQHFLATEGVVQAGTGG